MRFGTQIDKMFGDINSYWNRFWHLQNVLVTPGLCFIAGALSKNLLQTCETRLIYVCRPSILVTVEEVDLLLLIRVKVSGQGLCQCRKHRSNTNFASMKVLHAFHAKD
jgi:hypothetical protein